MTTTRVSVVVPNYNHGRHLGERLRTILDQTYTDFELIYLDDASTDDSEAVFAQFSDDPRVRAIRNEVNSGSPFAQWNRGVEAARGELVWIAEADDAAAPELLARLVGTLDANPSVGIAYCQSMAVDAEGAPLYTLDRRTEKLWPGRWKQDYVERGVVEIRDHMLLKCTIPNASAAVFRKETYQKAGGAPLDFEMSGDWMTWIQMLAEADVAFVAEPLNYFRKHAGSVRARAEREGLQTLEAYRVVEQAQNTLRLEEDVLERARDYHLSRWLKRATRRSDRIPARTHVAILHAARRLDPRLGRRIVRRLIGR